MYKVGDKFEIEIESIYDNNTTTINLKTNEITENKLYRIKGFNSLVFDENGLNWLKKANESDIIKLQDNAFHDGYKKAQCEAFNRGYDAGYKDGYESCRTEHKNNADEPIKTVKASELAEDTKVICWDYEADKFNRYFALLHNGYLYAYWNGVTSKNNGGELCKWKHMALEDGTIVLPE